MAFLDENIKGQLKQYFSYINESVSFNFKYTDNDKGREIKGFLEEITKLSENLTIVMDDSLEYRENSFEIYFKNKATGMVFSGIPSGHEFNSFILSILSLFGLGNKLTEEQKEKVNSIKDKKYIEVFITLSCTLCPEVVQGLNLIALNNENIVSNMIDGNCYIQEMKEKKISVSPTIYVNGKFVTSGKQSIDNLIDILK